MPATRKFILWVVCFFKGLFQTRGFKSGVNIHGMNTGCLSFQNLLPYGFLLHLPTSPGCWVIPSRWQCGEGFFEFLFQVDYNTPNTDFCHDIQISLNRPIFLLGQTEITSKEQSWQTGRRQGSTLSLASYTKRKHQSVIKVVSFPHYKHNL